MTRISIYGDHNNCNYLLLNFKNIRAVGGITPAIMPYSKMELKYEK
jgi:hypothetical protein